MNHSENIKQNIVNIMAYRAKNVDLAGNKPNKFKTKIENEFAQFNKEYPNMFRLCLEGFFDSPNAINQLDQFINMSQKVHDGEIPEKEASVAIGTQLVDTYVKPLINDKEKK